MGIQHAFRKRSCLEQAEAQDNGICRYRPERRVQVSRHCNAGNEYRINAYTDHNKKSLKRKGAKPFDIIVADTAPFPVAQSGKGNRSH